MPVSLWEGHVFAADMILLCRSPCSKWEEAAGKWDSPFAHLVALFSHKEWYHACGGQGWYKGTAKKITALYLRKVIKGWDSENAWCCHLYHKV